MIKFPLRTFPEFCRYIFDHKKSCDYCCREENGYHGIFVHTDDPAWPRIDYIVFDNDEDATAFVLKWGTKRISIV